MAKILVQIILLDNGIYLLHQESKRIFSHKHPHTLIGKLNDNAKISYKDMK